MSDDTERNIEEAFVIKYAAQGVILHYKCPMTVSKGGYLQLPYSIHRSSNIYSKNQWCETREQAIDAYRRGVERAIKSAKRKLKDLEKRLHEPVFEQHDR